MSDSGAPSPPPQRRGHAARRPRLDFRIGTHAQLRDWMLADLREGSGQATAGRPATPLNVDDSSGFVHALVSAWAAVGDNLAFYQERIAQEGYLRTATEAFSVRALNASVGYAPRKAASAVTHLAFTVADAAAGPASVDLPRGTAVQSLPVGGGRPVVFETDAALDARPTWNTLALAPAPVVPTPLVVGGRTTSLRVATDRRVRPGMALVVEDPAAGAAAPQVRLLDRVEALADGTTSLGWAGPLQALSDPAARPVLHVCREHARLFGATAADWSRLPDAVKAKTGTRTGAVRLLRPDGGWSDAAPGLPPGEVGAACTMHEDVLHVAVGDTVLRREAEGWTVCGSPSPRSTVTALRADAHGRLYAGLDRGEVLASPNGGRTWSPVISPTGQPAPRGHALRLPAGPVRDLLPPSDARGDLAVATGVGVWLARTAEASWAPWTEGLSASGRPVEVRALLRGRAGVAAATDAGLFHAGEPGSRWTRTSHHEGFALAQGGDQLLAATASGLLASLDGRGWRASATLGAEWIAQVAVTDGVVFVCGADGLRRAPGVDGPWTKPPFETVPALLAAAPAAVFAAAAFTGYAETDWPGLDRQPTPEGTVDLDRACPGLTPGGWAVLAGERLQAVRIAGAGLATRSDFGLSGRVTRLKLENAPPGLPDRTTDVRLVDTPLAPIAPPAPPPPPLSGRVLRVQGAHPDLAGRSLALSGRAPRIRLTGTAGTILRRSDGGEPSAEPQLLGPLDAREIAALPGDAGPLPPDLRSRLASLGAVVAAAAEVVSTDVGRWSVEAEGGAVRLVAGADGGRAVFASDLELLAQAELQAAGPWRFQARTPGGLDVVFEAGLDAVEHLCAVAETPGAAAAAKSAGAAEVAEVVQASPAPDGRSTVLTLAAPLSRAFDPATVRVNANVVRASQGETPVSAEVLGRGDNGASGQSFLLKSGPLSIPADPARAARGEEAPHGIEVRVRTGAAADALSLAAQLRREDLSSSGQLWTEVSDFDASGPLDAHYRVVETLDGGLRIVFGDGLRGRRLPTGAENVTALYRVGAGADGNVEAGRLTLAKRRPAWVRGVVNPVAAVGGAEAEDPLATRETGPVRARALSRVVSVRDVEGVALALPSVSKALALRRTGRDGAPVILLTVAGVAPVGSDATAAPAPVDLRAVAAAVRGATARPLRLVVAAARRVGFEAALEIDLADGATAPADAVAAVERALAREFGFAARGLGRPVHASALLACAQGPPEVAAAVLTRLNRSGEATADGSDGLVAAPAAFERDAAVGAELLVLDAVTVRVSDPAGAAAP